MADLRRQISVTGEHELAALKAAIECYRGPFLASYPLYFFPEFAEWAESIRRELETQMVQTYARAIPRLIAAGDLATAIRSGERHVELAPYDDAAQAHYVRALAADGQVARALRHLTAYQRTMSEEFEEEFEAELSSELQILIEQLNRPAQAAKLIASSPQGIKPDQPSRTQTQTPFTDSTEDIEQPRLPYAVEAMVGRRRESKRLFSLLDRGERLISVIGLGGAGKTFFIRKQLEPLTKRYNGHVHFVELRGMDTDGGTAADRLPVAIAAALRLSPQTGQPLLEQIAAFLAGNEACLILDNFESVQLAAGTVIELLESSPTITMLVTSRQRLNRASESIIPLAGLAVQAGLDNEAGAMSEAASLFALSTQRVAPSFTINDEARQQIEAICLQLGGLPLAIKLAAFQLDFYSLDELTATIRDDAAALAAEYDDLPDDHRSMQAVLNGMWRRLSADVQRVLSELSVFSDRWHREEMQAIVPASRTIYNELLNDSLLQTETPGWFSLHPLVKQYAGHRLSADSDVRGRHAAHFLGLLDLGEWMGEPTKILEPAIFGQLQPRREDIFHAWGWAITNRAWDLLSPAIHSLASFASFLLQRQRGVTLFEALVDALPEAQARTKAQQRLAGQAAFHICYLRYALGQFDNEEAFVWHQRAHAWLEAAGKPYEIAHAYVGLAALAMSWGKQHDECVAWLRKGGAIAVKHGYTSIRILANTSLLYWLRDSGQWAELDALDRETDALLMDSPTPSPTPYIAACQIAMQLDRWTEAEQRHAHFAQRFGDQKALNNRVEAHIESLSSMLLAEKGDFSAAAATYRAILPPDQVHPWSPAGITLLALYQALAGDEKASVTLQEGLALMQQNEIKYVICNTLVNTAATEIYLGETASTRAHVLDALAISLELADISLIFTALYLFATLPTELPPELTLRIVKTAAVCPAMDYTFRFLVKKRVQEEGIVISEDERARLWATDLEGVQALVEEVGQYVPEVRAMLTAKNVPSLVVEQA